jgi:hypothetical protein
MKTLGHTPLWARPLAQNVALHFALLAGGFWTLHAGYFSWDGYQTALTGWEIGAIHLFLLGLVGISETSRGTAESSAQEQNDDDTSYDETEYAAWAAWIAAAAGAFALIWNTDLTFLSGLLLLSVAAVWGFRLAPWLLVRRILALVLGGGFPWLVWTLDLVPTLVYDNYEFQLQSVPVVGMFSLFTALAAWAGHAQGEPFHAAAARRWEVPLAWGLWSASVATYAVLFAQIGLWTAAAPGFTAAAGGFLLAARRTPAGLDKWTSVGAQLFAVLWLLWTTGLLQNVEPVVG